MRLNYQINDTDMLELQNVAKSVKESVTSIKKQSVNKIKAVIP